MNEEFKLALESFNEEADRLMRNPITKEVLESGKVGGIKFKWEKQKDGKFSGSTERKTYDEHAIDSFILRLRYFMQNNEPSSFCNLSKFYEDSSLPKDLKQEFKHIRGMLNQYLDSWAYMELNNEKVTNRRILNAVMWGDGAHKHSPRSKPHREFFKKWFMNTNPIIQMTGEQLKNEFIVICIQFLSFITRAREVNYKSLENLKK